MFQFYVWFYSRTQLLKYDLGYHFKVRHVCSLLASYKAEKISSAQTSEADKPSCKDDAWTRAKTEGECLGLYSVDSNLSMNVFIQPNCTKTTSILEESHRCFFCLLPVVVRSNERGRGLQTAPALHRGIRSVWLWPARSVSGTGSGFVRHKLSQDLALGVFYAVRTK